MAYTPPSPTVDFNFTVTGYTSPNGNTVNFDFSDGDVASLSGDVASLSGSFQAGIDVAVLSGNIQVAGAFQSAEHLAYLEGNIGLTGSLEAGISFASFDGSLSLTGEFTAGIDIAVLNANINVTGSFEALNSAYLDGSIGFGGYFESDLNAAYLGGNIIFAGSFNADAGTIFVDKKIIVSRKYIAVLTGNPDLTFPISSINGILRSSGSATKTVVCPEGINYDFEINSRRNNQLRIYAYEYYMDGSFDVTLTDTLTSLDITYSQGARNYSITIQGSQSLSFPSTPRMFNATGVQYESLQANGARRVRCELNKDILPNDIIVMPNLSEIKIGSINHIITTNTKAMEIAELV